MIKTVFVSDIHYHKNYQNLVCSLVRNIGKINPDLIILGGDISDAIGGFQYVLCLFKEHFPDKRIAVIAGNHDLWCQNWVCSVKENTSEIIFNDYIPSVCDQVGVNYLEFNPIIINNCAFVGSIGWYDYSAKYPNLPYEDEYYDYNISNYTKDGLYVKMSKSNKEFAESCLYRLKTNIEILQNTKEIEHIYVFTHVPVFKECVDYRCGSSYSNYSWNLGCAYFYNLTIGDYLKTVKKVKAVVSGHTHRHFDQQVKGDHGNIHAFIYGGDYGTLMFYEIDVFLHDGSTFLKDCGTWKNTMC